MVAPACSKDEFIALFTEHGATETARILGISVRNVFQRRSLLEKNEGLVLSRSGIFESSYRKRIPIFIENGSVVIGSDPHYWPGIISTAHKALVYVIKDTKPALIILNGDVQDGASINRHPPIGWEKKPSVKEEHQAILERLTEIEEACSREVPKYWLLGNHCLRFESKLAQQSPEFEGVSGMTLKEHFPLWNFGMSLWINDSVVVKHRFKGGIHATHNNALFSGKSVVTGHLHSLKVTPFSDYNGTRFGIDTGTLADPYGPQFDYSEDNPLNHRSGFIVLTFVDGELLWPEVCRVISENKFEFRGKIIKL